MFKNAKFSRLSMPTIKALHQLDFSVEEIGMYLSSDTLQFSLHALKAELIQWRADISVYIS